VNPIEPDVTSSAASSWKCDKCSSQLPAKECLEKIKFINNHIQNAIADSKGSIQVFEFVRNSN
jgi:hypothetical protein